MQNHTCNLLSNPLYFIKKSKRAESALLLDSLCGEGMLLQHVHNVLFGDDSDSDLNAKRTRFEHDRDNIQDLYSKIEADTVDCESRVAIAIIVLWIISISNEELKHQPHGYVTNPIIVRKLFCSLDKTSDFDVVAWFLLSRVFLNLCDRSHGFMDSSVLYSLCNYCMALSCKSHLIECDSIISRKSKEHGVSELSIVNISNSAPHETLYRLRAFAGVKLAFDRSSWHVLDSLGVSPTP